MSAPPRPSVEELARAAEVLRTHPQVQRLAALGYDVLSRQAEGRALFAGEKFAQHRAEVHGVTRENADTAFGNVLAIIERGPSTAGEHALLAALFVQGFADALAAYPEERTPRIARFVEHAEWLALHSEHQIFGLIERLLPAAAIASVYDGLGNRVLAPATRGDADARHRSLQAGRIALLGQATEPAARKVLERIEDAAQDEHAALLASHALGRAPKFEATEAPSRLRGSLGRARREWLGSMLRAFTGLTLLSFIVRSLLHLCGVRREVELSLQPNAVSVEQRTSWLGRPLRSESTLCAIGELRSARRSARYGGLYALLGTVCFTVGACCAFVLAADAVVAQDGVLWLAALAAALLGSAIDLVASVVLSGRGARVTLELDFGKAGKGRVADLPLDQADGFLAALSRMLLRAGKGASGAVV